MRLFYRITGYLIISIVIVSVLRIKENIKDIEYLLGLLSGLVICGVLILGVYLLLKSYKTDVVKNNSKNVACQCGCNTFTHRHSNWIECTSCARIRILQ